MFLTFEGEAEITRTTESKQADRILAEGFPQEAATGQAITEVVVVRAEDGQVRSAAMRTRVAALAGELRAAGATRVVTYSEERRLVSQDRDSTVLLVGLGRDGEGDVDGVVAAVQRLDDEPGYQAAVTGEWTSDADSRSASRGRASGRHGEGGLIFVSGDPNNARLEVGLGILCRVDLRA
jgi:RND superfamily putative drug exporter